MDKNLPKKNEKAKRNFAMADLRAIEPNSDNQSTISGHAAVYGQMTNIGGWFNEIIEPGAFNDTDFRDVVFSVNHDLDKIPLARSRNNNANSTLQLQVDNIGLAVRANLDIENNVDAKSLYSSINRGDMDGMSFIFYVEEERWEGLDTNTPTRHIEKVKKVVEVSVVSFPAYCGTDIASSRDKEALDSAKLALENARTQELESSNDEEKRQLELEKLRTETLLKF
ncbi:caudovirus prohead protease [Clostridium puniceum]|uniref:Caudovirus prohead protease n=1 Tax=Clostridium puniceum TaxID=29367 RepID=A0A1S8TWL7_9CLOT|nr:HK97 family phage prohead protease [Clostridium puniceum]OOM81785.1 caudovirus prohead protease [Clostridium puniceum]